GAKAGDELVVNQIKSPACIDNFFIGQIIQLRAQHLRHDSTNLDESANSWRSLVWQIEDGRQRYADADRDDPVMQREGIFLHVIRRDRLKGDSRGNVRRSAIKSFGQRSDCFS